jgi:hypothetical protein
MNINLKQIWVIQRRFLNCLLWSVDDFEKRNWKVEIVAYSKVADYSKMVEMLYPRFILFRIMQGKRVLSRP